ncbi:MAG: DUF1365 family protein [Devosia sp.]
MNSTLYAGTVMHARLRPRRHKLKYRVFSLLLDLDEIGGLSRSLRLFGHNRPALFSFHDRDHGDGSGNDPRGWVTAQLEAAGVTLNDPHIEVLCYPRILGYVFNPLTVWFCRDGEVLRAILYEVHNTYGERHTYVIPVPADATGVVEQRAGKDMYVSPFMPMTCSYGFRITPPGERVVVAIDETDAEGLLLTASFAGMRQPLTDATLLRAFLAYPLMTLKVTGAIHWEALKLWLKGVPVFRHRPAAAAAATTIIPR